MILFEDFDKFLQKVNVTDGINIFDLDDTLFVTKAKIHVTDIAGDKFDLTPAEYNFFDKSRAKNIDYTDFNNPSILYAGKAIDWVLNILKQTHAKNKAVGIITARSMDAVLLKKFLNSHGVNIVENLIFPVKSKPFISKYSKIPNDIPKLKAKAIQEIIDMGFTDIKFFDDNKDNLAEIKKLETIYNNINIKTKHIKSKWIPSL